MGLVLELELPRAYLKLAVVTELCIFILLSTWFLLSPSLLGMLISFLGGGDTFI